MSSDDIVTRLREWAWQTERYTTAKNAALTLTEAADEIERLRAAGDALAQASTLDLCDCSNDDCMALGDAHRTWNEARQ